jgi:hypothetical protein
LATPNKKATTCYFRLVIEVYLRYWFPLSKEDTLVDSPKSQSVQGREEKKIVIKQFKKLSPKVVTK